MIGMIGYLGKVSPRKGLVSALLYALGTTIGATIVGFIFASIGFFCRWLLGCGGAIYTPGVLIPVGLASVFGGLRDLKFFRMVLPQPQTQVPASWWPVLGPYKTGFLWGLFVGLFFQTRIQYALYYVVALWVILIGQPYFGAQVL